MRAHLRSVAALSDAIPGAYLILGSLGVVVVAIGVISLRRHRPDISQLMWTVGASLSSAMLLAGAVPWERSGSPVAALGAAVAVGWALVSFAALLIGRLLAIPPVIAAAGIAVAALTVDAALGGPLQPGSLMNSRPIFGLRWYGFGNTTFAAYATNGLLLAGYLAHRLLAAGRRRAAVATVAVIGFGVVICQGWPSMGSDFGGVIALTPPVLWLMLAISGVSMTWPRLLAVGGSAVLAIGADLHAGLVARTGPAQPPGQLRAANPGRRRARRGQPQGGGLRRDDRQPARHRFAASSVRRCSISRSATWRRRWASEFSTVRPVLVALLATGVLGTVLNDAGISVWLTVSILVAVAVTWFWVDQSAPTGADRARPGNRAPVA